MIMECFNRLFPINRSLTGDGVRESLRILGEIVPIRQSEYPSGMDCFDWTVPKEWNVRSAWVKGRDGRTLIDFRDHNLHLVGYSVPVRATVSREELLARLHTRPDLPDAIPYVTSYYKEYWGFCVQHRRLAEFTDDEYEVVIDATLEDGHLTIGEGFIQGETDREILFSTYLCHPSMAINELSGPLVQTFVYKKLLEMQKRKALKYSYRFLYVPETIGSILYLSLHGEELKAKVDAGYVVTCAGHGPSYTYKKSRRGDSLADKAALHVLSRSGRPYRTVDWSPVGSDERQYGSQAFNLPVGSLMRTPYLEYKEYHTSMDNESLISEEALEETVRTYLDIVETLEANEIYVSNHTHGEPKLDKHGVYPTIGGQRTEEQRRRLFMISYLLAFSDGKHDLMDVADKLGVVGKDLWETAKLLEDKGLLRKANGPEPAAAVGTFN